MPGYEAWITVRSLYECLIRPLPLMYMMLLVCLRRQLQRYTYDMNRFPASLDDGKDVEYKYLLQVHSQARFSCQALPDGYHQ